MKVSSRIMQNLDAHPSNVKPMGPKFSALFSERKKHLTILMCNVHRTETGVLVKNNGYGEFKIKIIFKSNPLLPDFFFLKLCAPVILIYSKSQLKIFLMTFMKITLYLFFLIVTLCYNVTYNYLAKL